MDLIVSVPEFSYLLRNEVFQKNPPQIIDSLSISSHTKSP